MVLFNRFLGNGSVNILAETNTQVTIEEPVCKQRIGKSNNRGCWKLCYVFGPCRVVITKSLVEKSRRAVSSPCGGGIEYLHRDPASRRRRRKGKSQM
jgi:hypothetical protein